ncbi:MAG: hypothetical protein GXP55_17345 [Deltaproteobacteria bacterium]|nr:hypothetical protein [Deltaproteobacteria bacterium]
MRAFENSCSRHLAPWIVAAALAVPMGLAWASPTAAQESLRLFNEPTTFTDVPDAFDEQDPFDLNINLGFRRTQETGTIQRETSAPGGRDGAAYTDIANSERLRNTLDVGLQLGLFHDVAAFVTLPVVLSDTRSLRPTGGAGTEGVYPIHDGASAAAMGMVPLFSTNFDAPTRSGIDQILFGFDLGIMNQMRTPELPTWTLHLEGRFGIGEAMKACADGDATCTPGVSRGNNGLRIETRMSRRYRYIEPYSAIGFQIEWPGNSDRTFLPSGNLSGYMNTKPPILGEFTAGVAIIPWEQKERWQRFVFDVRLHARYVSEGRDYSPLFDALGSSQSPYLNQPSCEGIPRPGAGDCDANPGGYRLVDFTGLTDTQGHGEYGMRLAVEMQAARYVRFGFGADLTWITSYIMTFTDACNPNVNPAGADDNRAGSCRGGIINPAHRPAIDTPGNRFRFSNGLRFQLFASATAQF